MKTIIRTFLVAPFFCSAVHIACAADISGPLQPTTGPGGQSYAHSNVTKMVVGSGPSGYCLFEPAGPKPETAPLIVFLHGWAGTNPAVYGGWIEHLVRRGNIVIYPFYQIEGKFRYPPGEVTANAVRAVGQAIAELNTLGHVRPDLGRFALVGHSAGGMVSINLAVAAADSALPAIPKAVMAVQPGKSSTKRGRPVIPLEDLGKLPASVYLLAVTGDKDRVVKEEDARRIISDSIHVPATHKNFVRLISDDHGSESLSADHFAPLAYRSEYHLDTDTASVSTPRKFPSPEITTQQTQSRFRRDRARVRKSSASINPRQRTDALDFYGTWKLFDGLLECAFYQRECQFALGNSREQKFMGVWSDGVPVKELIISPAV